MMKEGLDTEYLLTLIRQLRCEHFSFGYLREKVNVDDAILDTIERDILLKSGRLRKLEN